MKVTRAAIEIDGRSIAVSQVSEVRLHQVPGALSLTFVPFFTLSALAIVQARHAQVSAMWAIAGALALLGLASWLRRRGPSLFQVICSCSDAEEVIAEYQNRPDANLVRDAIASALPA